MGSQDLAGQEHEPWAPTRFERFEEALDTSMGTARIVTDAGPGYVKALGNPQGPHPLACELVATRLADWFGLCTFDVAIIEIDADVDEIPFFRGGFASSGPAFVTRAVIGHPWGGTHLELTRLVNSADVGRLVVFDTWVKNSDRHPPDLERRPNYDNVFLEDLTGNDSGQCRLIAMDHTHCFTCGRDLTSRIATIDQVRDNRLYGLFPGFVPHVFQEDVESAIDQLRGLTDKDVRRFVQEVPDEWEVSRDAREALVDLVCQRAQFLARTSCASIAWECWPNQLFDDRSTGRSS